MATIYIILAIAMAAAAFYYFKTRSSLNDIENKAVGQGQYGSAAWATHDELEETFKKVLYDPRNWRRGKNLPTAQGLIVHCEESTADFGDFEQKQPGAAANLKQRLFGKKNVETEKRLYCYVDDSDVHTLLIGASGIGKTASFLYPNIEYAFASGMSFFTTDTKGDLYRNTGTIGEKYYGYHIKVIDLRNPLHSTGYNMIYLVNKYMDAYKKKKKVAYLSKAEKYAKITAKTIIEMGVDPGSFGQNSYFYDSAEGIVTATLLLLAEYGKPGERHIVSCFKLIQDLMSPSRVQGKNQFQILVDILPDDNRARFYAASALKSSGDTMASVMSTAMSRLLTFIDSELEQIMCFKNMIDIEKFCKEKTAIYIVLPEEDTTKHFLAGLFIQQMYREMLIVADKNGGRLDNRVMYYCDELGTMPKIDGLESMFSAARSRKISIIAIIQSLSQFDEKYGKEGSEIIRDNCQNTMYGGFAPNSTSAKILSEALGTYTAMSGSITYSGEKKLFRENVASRTVDMIERPLMTESELKSIPIGCFILTRTGHNPFKVKLKYYKDWGINFEKKYKIPANPERKPKYADKNDICDAVCDSNPKIGD